MRKFSKREFLGSFGTVALTLFLNQAKAATILESLQTEAPGPLERELINNPKKQILLAESEKCGSCTPFAYKNKCNSTDECSAK
jgi:hypothetical protein